MPDPLADKWQEIIDEVRESGARFPVLQTLCLGRRRELTATSDLDREVARHFGKEPEAVERLRVWVEQMGRGEASLEVCRGVSCRSNGSEDLHDRLFDVVDGTVQRDDVHCLDNCDRGPSLALDGRIYSGSTEDVADDERSWRDGSISRQN